MEITTPEFLPNADGRTVRARKVKAIVRDWADEFGVQDMTTTQSVLFRRCAILAIIVEEHESDFLNFGTKLPASYFTAIRTLQQLMNQLDRQRHFGVLAA